MTAPIPDNEAERLLALQKYNILDTPPEQAYDDITLLASHICGTPMAVITLIDAERQWFKSKVGMSMTETSRNVSFCAHTILQKDLFIIHDLQSDKRFSSNPFVASDPKVRFYAGAPLINPEGMALGTLCIIDLVPRQLTAEQETALRALSRQVISQLELRRNLADLGRAELQIRSLNEDLEYRVLERTKQLTSANQQLETEITERKRAEEKVNRLAYYDSLTDLPNRFLFLEQLKETLQIVKRENKPLSVMMIEMDRFREIENTIGYQIGAVILKQLGRSIREVLRKSDVIARIEGGKFVVFLPFVDAEAAVLVAQKIQKLIERPLMIEGLTIYVEVCIGIAAFPDHGEDADRLIRSADCAMSIADQMDGKCFVYATEKEDFNPHRMVLMAELRHALDRDELFLQYQPKVDLKTNRITGVEALVRWKHPERGIIPPDQFIRLAEQSGLIKPMTLWVFKSALNQCCHWRREGSPINVAMNLSARNLLDPKLPDQISALLRSNGVSAECIDLEITESIIMVDPARAMEVLTHLKNMGVGLAIDDFGTGYSSLGYLKKLPVDTIKIDKSFVMKMATNPDDAVIVRSTVDLAHNLGLKVVAEGVEDKETWNRLAAMGCDTAQGYYMSRPISAVDLKKWMEESPWGLHGVAG